MSEIKRKLIPTAEFTTKKRQRCAARLSRPHQSLFSRHCGTQKDHQVEFPSEFNLCDKVPIVWDQGATQSCTSNAVTTLFMMVRTENGYPLAIFSRRWLYFMERVLEAVEDKNHGQLPSDWFDTTKSDTKLVTGDIGANANDGLQIVISKGCPLESSFPFLMKECPELNATPPESLKEEAAQYIPRNGVDLYVDTVNGAMDGRLLDPKALLCSIKSQLYVYERPVIVGFMCYAESENNESITLDADGVLKLPPPHWINVGAHEVTIVGWNDRLASLVILNSWGPDWGVQPDGAKTKGYFYMSYDFAFHTERQNHDHDYDMTAEFRTLVMDSNSQ